MTGFLIIAAVFAGWVLSLYVHPFGICPYCHGKRVIVGGRKRKPKPRTCSHCKGIGRRQRPGSRTVHRLVRRVRRELARQRKQRQLERMEMNRHADIH